jgi:hypothetical protein
VNKTRSHGVLINGQSDTTHGVLINGLSNKSDANPAVDSTKTASVVYQREVLKYRQG